MDGSRDTGTLSGPRNRTMRLLREAARELLRTGGPLTVPARGRARRSVAGNRLPLLPEQRRRGAARDDVPRR